MFLKCLTKHFNQHQRQRRHQRHGDFYSSTCTFRACQLKSHHKINKNQYIYSCPFSMASSRQFLPFSSLCERRLKVFPSSFLTNQYCSNTSATSSQPFKHAICSGVFWKIIRMIMKIWCITDNPLYTDTRYKDKIL